MGEKVPLKWDLVHVRSHWGRKRLHIIGFTRKRMCCGFYFLRVPFVERARFSKKSMVEMRWSESVLKGAFISHGKSGSCNDGAGAFERSLQLQEEHNVYLPLEMSSQVKYITILQQTRPFVPLSFSLVVRILGLPPAVIAN